jgi:hypothetical protein
MKMFTIALGLLVLSTPAFAQNWMPLSGIQAKSMAGFTFKEECEKSSKEKCLDLGSEPEKVAFSTVDQGFLAAVDEEVCSGEMDCQTKLVTKVCSLEGYEKFIDAEYTKTYCTKAYANLVVDEAAFSAHKAGKAQQATLNAGIAQAEKSQECGRKTIAYLLVRNAPKGLTTAQVKQLHATYSGIQLLLTGGSLVSAKEEIAAVAADGVLVTEADKVALSSFIDGCKP